MLVRDLTLRWPPPPLTTAIAFGVVCVSFCQYREYALCDTISRLLSVRCVRVCVLCVRLYTDLTLQAFLLSLIGFVLKIVLVTIVVKILGLQILQLTAFLAACTVAIGLSIGVFASNAVAGIMILLNKPFVVGNMITAAGQTGVVEKIELFSTILTTYV